MAGYVPSIEKLFKNSSLSVGLFWDQADLSKWDQQTNIKNLKNCHIEVELIK